MTNQERKLQELDVAISIHLLGARWWRFRYAKKDGGDGSRWQQLIGAQDSFPKTHPQYHGKEHKARHPTLEDSTIYEDFRPTRKQKQAWAVLMAFWEREIAVSIKKRLGFFEVRTTWWSHATFCACSSTGRDAVFELAVCYMAGDWLRQCQSKLAKEAKD